MKYFSTYVSNTTAGSGSQTVFFSDNKPHTGRVFYRVTNGGRFNYSFLFTMKKVDRLNLESYIGLHCKSLFLYEFTHCKDNPK